MKINHVIPSIDKSTGGPARSVTHLIQAMLQQTDDLHVDLNTGESEHPIITNFSSKRGCINFHTHEILMFSKSLREQLSDLDTDIFHGHGLWQYPVHQMAKMARKRKIPYIITARGMLEPWALEQGKLKKKLALKLFQHNDLAKATCLHATAPMEVDSIRNLGLKQPIAMIPNGVNISEFPDVTPLKVKAPKKILFLSRIHHKKGIELLIHAWIKLDKELRKNWQIDIVGNGEQSYINSLQLKINKAFLQEEIIIQPPVFGKEKVNVFREASLFVLPTHSENFGIVIAEALASYTPVITTKGTPWEELSTHNAGWWIDIGIEPLKNALTHAMQTPKETLEAMGNNGRQLIEEKYSMEAVASQMLQLYKWILNKENKPYFVDTL
ncbi:glycosyltransferase [Algibacter mikhailovii]|uniref:glycosyltransferase n=1 Tax=Algibacter mikhailovii TaxID=425498 RepID=UPI002494ACEF|nr:glycosyltransferase [Algibacter mikhailovii]